MKTIYKIVLCTLSLCTLVACEMNEQVYDRIDATVYYQNEASVKGAVAAIYGNAAMSYLEYFWYLNEFSADQIVWRVWNGGLWGYDEGEKTVLSTHTWTAESKIIRSTWETAWSTIGLCNTLISDLGKLNAREIGMTEEKLASYIAEVRTLRAWAYYNCFELWGGAIPLYTEDDGTIPGSADEDFQQGCLKVYDFICTELDDTYAALPKEDGTNATRNRMNQAVNRMIKMRMLLNSEVFTGTARFDECATLAQELINGTYGVYGLATDYRDIYHVTNTTCPEVVMAFAMENGQLNAGWMRDMPFLAYTYSEYFGFSFVSKKAGGERDIKGKPVTHTLTASVGSVNNVWADRWAAYFSGDDKIIHNGPVVYVLDGKDWGMNTTLYMWGDVNDLNGGWPGMSVTGTETIGEYTYLYFDLGEANVGLKESLILSNNGATQLGDFPGSDNLWTISENLYLYMGADGVVQITDPEHPGDVEWFDPKAAPKEEAVIDLYFHNATETLGDIQLYAWGNAEAFGGWPGQSFAAMDTTAILGLELIHTQITGFVGDTYHLIVNNGNGTQLDDYTVTAEEAKNEYYLKITDEGVSELSVVAKSRRK